MISGFAFAVDTRAPDALRQPSPPTRLCCEVNKTGLVLRGCLLQETIGWSSNVKATDRFNRLRDYCCK